MPANTPSGLPYPLPTEPVAEGAAAIRALAEALDGRPKSLLASSAVFAFAGNDNNYRIYSPPLTELWSDWPGAVKSTYIEVPVTGRYYVACTLRNPIASAIGVSAIVNDAQPIRKLQVNAIEGAGAQRGDYTAAGYVALTAGSTLRFFGFCTGGVAGTTSLLYELMLLGKPIGAATREAESDELERYLAMLETVENPEYAE